MKIIGKNNNIASQKIKSIKTKDKNPMKRILIVDDMNEWLNFHLESFKLFFDEEFEIDLASNANEGLLKTLKNKPYNIIITDLEMEDVTGASCAGQWLLRQLKNEPKCKETKFLIISARYNIKEISNESKALYIAKDDLLNNRQCFKYKINDII